MNLGIGIEKKVGICDIETLSELFDVGCYDPDTGDWVEFEVSHWKNELYEFVKWYTSKPMDFLVTFNGIGFDQQVLEWVVDNHQKWFDLSNLEICKKIGDYAGKVIEDSRYNIPHTYSEKKFSIAPLDVFRIHHFDNEAKMTSLKWCAFMMNMDVEEMPIHHLKKDLTKEEIILIQEYRRNDVIVTLGVLYITLGRVEEVEKLNGGFPLPELKDYLGKNMIQDRYDVMKETGLMCLNWSDVKIGEEWNKEDYKSAEQIRNDSEGHNRLFSKSIKYPYGQRFKNFFPKTMKFTTDHLKKFIENLGNQYVTAEKQEFDITIGSTKYTIAKGGIHSNEKNRFVVIPYGWFCEDSDVGSQYPNSIRKFGIFPPHLKPSIMDQFKGKITKRFYYKDMATKLKAEGKEEEARSYTSVQDMLKLCLNGGYYGKLGQKGSFLHYPEGLLKVCMGNQIEILMAIEMMEEAGFKVISGNTDGFVTLFPEEREQEFREICKKWEETVGNTDMGKLEYTKFVTLAQDSINSYIAKKSDGKVKKKGRFATEFLLNKNKSARIIPLALEQYFIYGKDPVEFITNHTNIYDFVIAKKAAGQLHYEEQWEENGQIHTKVHKKLVRYFISKEGTILYKRGINNHGDPMNNHVNAPTCIGQPLVTYFNKGYKSDDYGIDHSFYIAEVLERIDNIEKTNKADKYCKKFLPSQQTSLF